MLECSVPFRSVPFRSVRKLCSYIRGWRGVTLAIYLWLILMSYAIVHIDVHSKIPRKNLYIISVIEVVFAIAFYAAPKLLKHAEKITLASETLTQSEQKKFFLKTFIFTFLEFFAMYLLFYPGSFGGDNVSQYAQAVGAHGYNDHHPVLHTLFTFTLPLRLTGGWVGSIVLFQIILFSLSLAYMGVTVAEFGNRLYAKNFLLYIMLNPFTLYIGINPLKDSSLAIAAMVLMCFALRTYYTNGAWIKNWKNAAMFVIILTAATIFRHNAILFTLPLMLTMSFYVSKRKLICMIACVASMIYLVRYPLYNWLDVDRSMENRQIEMLGFPMTIIGNSVKEAHEKLDEEVLEFAYTIAPQDVWEDSFELYSGFNSTKGGSGHKNLDEETRKRFFVIDIYAIERAGWRKILNLTARCFAEAPLAALRGACVLINSANGILGHLQAVFAFLIQQEATTEHGVDLHHSKFLKLKFLPPLIKISFLSDFNTVKMHLSLDDDITLQAIVFIMLNGVMVIFKHIFQNLGLINLAIVTFILAKLNFKTSDGWKKFTLALPILLHNWGTTLFLTGLDLRYFYLSFLVLPSVLLILIKDKN